MRTIEKIKYINFDRIWDLGLFKSKSKLELKNTGKVALVCIAKNEDDYIQEWVDYHLKLGFDDIFIYQNNWRSNIVSNQVHLIPFDGEAKQMTSYNDFIQNNYLNYEWAAFIDVDEFIVLKKHCTIKDFIFDYQTFNCISVNWYFFGNNGHETIIENNYNNIERFTKRASKMNNNIKTISKLSKDLKYINAHFANCKWVDSNKKTGKGPYNKKYSDDIIQINHYFSKTKEEFKLKVSKGLADQIGKLRSFTDYDKHNFNETDDFTALVFKNNNVCK